MLLQSFTWTGVQYPSLPPFDSVAVGDLALFEPER